MFAIAKTSRGDKIPGVLLYYSDPVATNHAREGIPPSAVLAQDIHLYSTSGDLPKFSFISAFSDRRPLVCQGFLKPENDSVSLLVENFKRRSEAKLSLSFEEFKNENAELLSMDPRSLPIVLAARDEHHVRYTEIASFQKSYNTDSYIKSWVGSMTHLLKEATKEMVGLLQKPKSELRKLIADQESKGTVDASIQEKGVFWLWWSISKPNNLQTWMATQSKRSKISNEELQTMYREYHPTRVGFYRVWLSEEHTFVDEDPSVDVCWFSEHEWIQYRVTVMLGKDGSVPFGPNGSTRAKLGIQNKLSVPYSEKTMWDMEDNFGMITAFIVPDYGTPPCSISRAMGIRNDEIEDLKAARFGPGSALTKKLQSALLNDAIISSKRMWKI